MKIQNWEAKRAGGRITISGVDAETGRPAKIVGVDRIAPVNMQAGNVALFAFVRDGEQVELLIAPAGAA